MTTLAELVAATPAYDRGVATQIQYGTGTWRLVIELADPAAGASVVWYDITDLCLGYEYQRGADEYAGRYRAGVATIELQGDGDDLAPWNDDTSSTFGTHVDLGAGLIIRAGFIRVSGTTVHEWYPRFTHRVESWSDVARARGQLRTHTVVTRDLLVGIINTPLAARAVAENWSERLEWLIPEADWDFDETLYGATFTSGAADILTVPTRSAVDNALAELDATCDPAGLVMYTNRKGQMIVRPQVGDTFHADAFTAGASGTPWTDPATVVFSSNAETDGYVAYYTEIAEVFGIADTEEAVVNKIKTDDGTNVYEASTAASITRYGNRPRNLAWIVENDDVADDILARLDYASKEAAPVTTSVDLPGFFPFAAELDWLSPLEVRHQSAAGRDRVTAEGVVRTLIERVAPRHTSAISWEIQIVMDVDEDPPVVAELNPPTSLSATTVNDTDATFGWTNPVTQPETPTGTQVRIREESLIWLTLDYPITSLAWLGLLPSTPYTFDVRLIREVDGRITNQSAATTVTITTDPLEEPIPSDGGGGDIDVDFDPPSGGCTELDWKLERSTDGTTWSQVGSIATITAAPWSVTIDSTDFTTGYLYRVCQRCGAPEGAWTCSVTFNNLCATPADLAVEPFDDTTLVVYVPKICPPTTVVEAVSDAAAFSGPSSTGWQGTDTAPELTSGSTAGLVAYGNASDSIGVVGDRTVQVVVELGDGAAADLMWHGGIKLRSTLAAAGAKWKAAATIYTRDAGLLTLSGSTELELDTEYTVAVTYDEATGIAILLVDGAQETTTTASTPGPTITGIPGVWSIELPEDSVLKSAGVWSSVVVAPAAFVPTDIAGCDLWLDASDETTITDTGGDVTGWDDKTTNNRDFSQSTSGWEPTTGVATINSLNAIRFQGNNFLSMTSPWMIANSGTTVFIVTKVPSGVSALRVAMAESSSSATTPNLWMGHLSNGDAAMQIENSGSSQADSTDSNTQIDDAGTHILVYVDTGSGMWHRVDGADTSQHTRSSPKSYTRSGSYTVDRCTVGNLWRVSTNGFNWHDDIGEVIVYDSVLSTTDVDTVEEYLADKWGVTLP